MNDLLNLVSPNSERTEFAQQELDIEMVRRGQHIETKKEQQARMSGGSSSLPACRRVLLGLHERACSSLARYMQPNTRTGRRAAGYSQLSQIAEQCSLPVLTSVLLAATGSLLLSHSALSQSYFCDQVGRAVREFEEHRRFQREFEKWSRLQQLEWRRHKLHRTAKRQKTRELHTFLSGGTAPSERHENRRTQMGAAWLATAIEVGLVEQAHQRSTRGNRQPLVVASSQFRDRVEALQQQLVDAAWFPMPMVVPPKAWDCDWHLWGGGYDSDDIPAYGFCKDWTRLDHAELEGVSDVA